MGDEPPGAAPQHATTTNGATKKRKKRVRNFTPDDRAAHREFEKSRRIAFNQRLLELASLLPGLESARLSKHIIVDESIAHHNAQRESCQRATREIQLLQAERDELISEVNALRASYLPGQVNLTQARPVNVELLQALDVPPRRPVDALAHGLHDADLPQGQSQSLDSNGHPAPVPATSTAGTGTEAPLPISTETEPFSIPTATIPAGLQADAFSIPSSANTVPAPFFTSASFDTLTTPPSGDIPSANPPPLRGPLDETNSADHFPRPALNQGSTSLEPSSAGVSALPVGMHMTDTVQPLQIPNDIDFNWQSDPGALYDIQPEHFLSSSFPDGSHEAHPLPHEQHHHSISLL